MNQVKTTKLSGLVFPALAALVLVLAAGPLTAEQPAGSGPITVSKSVRPEVINPRGYGAPDRATITIAIRGDLPVGERLPLDLVFLIDRSATMDITRIRAAVAQVLELLDSIDQIGLVSFADSARTDMGLTPANPEGKATFLRAVEALSTGGKTACSAGVAEASALLRSGRANALPVMVFLTDGMCSHGQEPEGELARAVAEGIAPLVVGVGMVSPIFPGKIGRIAGVRFFSSPAFFLDYLEQTLQELIGLAGMDLVLVERLPGYIRYEGEPSELPVSVEPSEGGWTIVWRRERLGLGEAWQVSFSISAEKTGTILVESGGELLLRNPLSGAPLPPIRLPEATIRVKNVPPRCGFSYEPAKPTVNEDVNFYDQSNDPFGGVIVSWLWDFGDGATSPKRNPSHRYKSDGQYLVKLLVTDEEGAACEASQMITVGAIEALLTRTVLTYPREQLLPGQDYPVSVAITPKVCINGLGLRELYPQGWTITPVESAGAQFRPPNEWIWLEPLCPPQELKLSYKVAVPVEQAPGRYALSGTAISFSPKFEIRVGGLVSLEVVEKLPIEVAVACLDVAANRPDPASCYDPQGRAVIKEAQIERAKELYLKGEPVPGTKGAIIDYEMMLRLLAYYRTGTPVTEPLPNN
ncbi:MAG: PKD domain-containing protein [Candidatus Bipolaricaulia bacterium]